MFDEQKFLETVNAIDTGNYTMRQEEMITFFNQSNGDWFYIAKWAFQFGFLKGQRAEKARRRKAVSK